MSHVFTQVPASSGSKGIQISNMLQAAGKSVIGWERRHGFLLLLKEIRAKFSGRPTKEDFNRIRLEN